MKNFSLSLKIVLIGLFTLGVSNPLFAQDEESDDSKSSIPLSYGFKAGTSFHNLTDQQPHTGGKVGFSAGAFASYPISDLFSVQMDIAYFQQGGTYVKFIDETRYGAPVENYYTKYVKDASVTLHNVYVPLQAKFSIFDKVYLPDLLVGPYMDINFAATENYEKTGQINDQYVTTTGENVVTDQYKLLQFGATAGLNFNIPTSKDFSFLFEVSYKYGLFPVKESYSYIDFYNVREDINSNALSVSVGLKF
ncbi:MAG: porin family protein [Bacteroidota bacterium]